MTAMIEKNPRQGVELRTWGDFARYTVSWLLCVGSVAAFWWLVLYAFSGGAL